MTKRGGSRVKSGRKSRWTGRGAKTKTIRVPDYLADRLLEIAERLDSGHDFSGPPLSHYSHISSSSITIPEFKSAPLRMSQLSLAVVDPETPIFSELEFDGMARKVGIESLYYITHVDNIPSILQMGILSHARIENEGIRHRTIYNAQVIDRRSNREVQPGRNLWSFANLYFQPRNPMLYAVIHKAKLNEIAVLAIKKEILNRKGVFITSGNAASPDSQIMSFSESKTFLSKIRNETDKVWWNADDGSKRKIMAECLVPDLIPADLIQSIYVPNDAAKSVVDQSVLEIKPSLPVVVAPERFFQPNFREKVADNISLVRGDMFFSKMQTLTISVNCVGVMGKGLASTAKYRFPDVYVKYETLCRNKTLQLGKPYIHKRESSVLDELGDEALLFADIEDSLQTWFMLFPTKDHWKNNSKLEPIEAGLKWFCDNYKKQGVKSVAFPALGCGNGNLSWAEVGPLMCRYLSKIEIPVSIYLPAEVNILPEWITADFLLADEF